MKFAAIALLLLLTGCAYNPKVIVYGTTGKQYIAPDLCAAEVQCKMAAETECRYNSTVVTTIDGKGTVEYTCQAAK
jgi:starvation-inducible outer membrane lipoprotein